jgi:hypothetical protein
MSADTYRVLVAGGICEDGMEFEGYTEDDIEADRHNGFEVTVLGVKFK